MEILEYVLSDIWRFVGVTVWLMLIVAGISSFRPFSGFVRYSNARETFVDSVIDRSISDESNWKKLGEKEENEPGKKPAKTDARVADADRNEVCRTADEMGESV